MRKYKFDANAYGNPIIKRNISTNSHDACNDRQPSHSEGVPQGQHKLPSSKLDSENSDFFQSLAASTQEELTLVNGHAGNRPRRKITLDDHTQGQQHVKTSSTLEIDPIAIPEGVTISLADGGSATHDRDTVQQNLDQGKSLVGPVELQHTTPQPRSTHEFSLSSKGHLTQIPACQKNSPCGKEANGATVPVNHSISRNGVNMGATITSNPLQSYAQHTDYSQSRNKSQDTMQELLDQARKQEMKGIQTRIRVKERDGTAVNKDLATARNQQLDTSSPRPSSLRSHLSNAKPRSSLQPSLSAIIPAARPNQKPPSSITNGSSGPFPKAQSRFIPSSLAPIYHDRPKSERVPEQAKSSAAGLQPSSSRESLAPVEVDITSNASALSLSSNASQASFDSVHPLRSGKSLHVADFDRPHPLVDWEGILQPPPPDWSDRPRFEDNSREYHDRINQWIYDTYQVTFKMPGEPVVVIPSKSLQSKDILPDGLSMVSMYTTITKQNAEHYGYEQSKLDEIIRYAQPVEAHCFEDWGKIDMSKPENASIKDETSDDLISSWIRNTAERRRHADAQIEAQIQAAEALLDYKAPPNPSRPMLNIYLRPACSEDIPQMTRIYNWYIEHTPRPAETGPIPEEDMEMRLEDVRSSKLPFIVAVERTSEFCGQQTMTNRSCGTHVPTSSGNTIVGWACAQHFTAYDYVEHITADLEVYVDPARRQLGVGRCLMDKLLEACDRGYIKRGGYPWLCPGQEQHLYSPGGGRDLHKIVFILRKWKHPRSSSTSNTQVRARKPRKGVTRKKPENGENEYDAWLKQWMEYWGFEVEGVLKGAGAKNGRFVDVVHLSKETSWQPAEGRIPEPVPDAH